MALTDAPLFALNAGEVSRLSLARTDLAKFKVACETELNFLPHVLGPAQFRPGGKFIDHTPSDAAGWLGEFYFDEVTKALLVATTAGLQFMVSDSYVTRISVATAVTNAGFNTDLAGWTQSDESGATSSWAGGLLQLVGTGTNYAFRDQQVSVAAGDLNKEHALRLIVVRGITAIQVGVAQGDGTYWDLTGLRAGSYSLAFTPTGDFWIRLGANTTYPSYIDSVAVEGAGVVSIPVPWGAGDFGNIRYDQSGDVLFVACTGFQQRRIERRASNSRSWALVLYQVDDGPFRLANTADTTIAPSATTGTATLIASRDLFQQTHVGALFRGTHSSQSVTSAIAAQNVFTNTIRVSGLASHNGNASSRGFAITITGTFVATVTLQRSIGAPGSWSDVKSWTGATAESYDDGLDNQIIYYRLGVKTGNYTSGTATSELDYSASSQTGICRITSVINAKTATADILAQFGAASATSDWSEGEWSDYRGWPAAVSLHDGRLFWQGALEINGSVSDAFGSFDDTVTGDSGPIDRVIVTGGLDGGRWLLSLQRLIAGTAAQEISIRSSAFDEPLTPTAFVARACSTRGAAKVRPFRVDTRGVFVGRAWRVYQLAFDLQKGDYVSTELTRLKQEMCAAGVVDVAIQRQPDTRLWFVLADGTCAVLVYEPEDDVIAWVPVSTANGVYERVAILPSADEDDVYFIVRRVIGGVTKRFVEKLAKRSECQGGTVNKTMDAHIVYSGAPTATIAGLGYLEGQSVVAWGDGVPYPGPFTVTGGAITLPTAVSNAVVGLAYTAQLKTTKLAYGAEHGTALTMRKRVARAGFVMADVVPGAVRIGRNFTNMTGLPATYRGKALTTGQVLTAYDTDPVSFNGGWDPDSRLCLQVSSPYPCTVMGVALQMSTNEPDDAAPRNPG